MKKSSFLFLYVSHTHSKLLHRLNWKEPGMENLKGIL